VVRDADLDRGGAGRLVVSPTNRHRAHSGLTESAIHAAMSIESGLPTVLGRFCVNSGVLGLTYGTLTVHELTAIWDGAYADGRREVTPTEQYVHGFLGRCRSWPRCC
jgi:hypothetical protein